MRTIDLPQPARLNGHDAASAFFAPLFTATDDRERLFVAHVDEQGRCLGLIEYDGGPTHVDLPVRQILTHALSLGSAGILLAHNHPGGDPSPSRADLMATRRLSTAGEAMNLSVVDHLVFAGAVECTSMRRLGYL